MQDKTYSSTIEVVYPDGRHMTAWLGKTDVFLVNTPFQNTEDPKWHAQEAGHAETEGEWMPYMTGPGSYSESKTHAHYDVAPPGVGAGPYIWIEFEHRDKVTGTPDPDDSHKPLLIFRDWNGALWKATVMTVQPIPGQPRFYLEQL